MSPKSSLRAVLRGGADVGSGTHADLYMVVSRLEACPVVIGNATVDVRPCAAADLGVLGASAAGKGDAAFWAALAAHARWGVAVASGVRLEAQAGVLVPLTSYEVVAGVPARTLEKTKVAGVALGAGVMFALP